MGVALIAWGRFFDADGNKVTVPAPSTETHAPWLWDWLAAEAPALRSVGFTAIQLPPASKAQGGAGAGCDGYGVFDPRDLGDKPQQGSTPTRYGSAESLRRMVACAHAVGLDVYLDVVLHQLIGENGGPGVFAYVGPDGKTLNGRGRTTPGWFRGNTGNNDPVPPFRPADAVPVPADDFPFGREKVFQNCSPARATIEDALDYGAWLFDTTGADGLRFDDTKGTWAPFVAEFLRSGPIASRFAYSEYFDGNPANLNWWATSAPMSGRSLVEDFTLHWALQAACDGGDARALDGAGFKTWRPDLACTFVDNPDTDTSPGEQIIGSKLLGYACLLTSEGYPFVYGKDYFPSSVWPGAYGLKPWIDNLIWIHENLAFGGTVTRWVDGSVICQERTGYPNLLTALNFDTWNARPITVQTGFGAGVELQDYTGRHPNIRTDSQGRASFTVPSNAYSSGQSYLCFSRVGYGQPFAAAPREGNQTFTGAFDMPLGPMKTGTLQVGRIWVAAGAWLSGTLTCDTSSWGNGVDVAVHIEDDKGFLVMMPYDDQGDATQGHTTRAKVSGWHSVSIVAVGLPDAGAPFSLRMTYTAGLYQETAA